MISTRAWACRTVEHEWLDSLPPDHPEASASRRDLRLLNRIMGHARVLAACVERATTPRPITLADLGSGDGWLMLSVARRLPASYRGSRAILIDRSPCFAHQVLADFQTLGWHTEIVRADAMEWASQPGPGQADCVLANLFLHHLEIVPLKKLLADCAGKTRVFAALEPRRGWLALALARTIGLLGCNRITRHDAPVSVLAGFSGCELSQLWPAGPGWELEERPVGFVSHLFVAEASAPGGR